MQDELSFPVSSVRIRRPMIDEQLDYIHLVDKHSLEQRFCCLMRESSQDELVHDRNIAASGCTQQF